MNRHDRMNLLRNLRNIPNVDYGMYVEIYDSSKTYYGILEETDGDYIFIRRGMTQIGPFHPTWQTVYYDNEFEKNVVYDFRE